MILVTTTGKVGSEASRLLAKRSVPVRVLAHHPSQAAALAEAGVDVVEGDLDVPESIDMAMQGVSSVVLMSPAIPAQELNVIESALRADGSGVAGARHVVKITSKAFSDSPIARRRGQAQVENRLIASGLGYTLMRNNAHMQNFIMPAPHPVRARERRIGQPAPIDSPMLTRHLCS